MVDSKTITTVLKGAQLGTGLLGTTGQVASTFISVPLAYREEGERRAAVAKMLSRENLEALASGNPALKRKLTDIDDKTIATIRNAFASAGGAAVGAAAGSAVPVLGTMVGGIVGSIVGGTAASMADDALFRVESNDAFEIKAYIDNDLRNGVPVSEAKMFALLASTLPSQQVNSLNNRLSELTNGKVTTLEQAVKNNKIQELEALMCETKKDEKDKKDEKNPGIDEMIRAHTGLDRKFTEPQDGRQVTAAAEFADMVNNGMDTAILMRTDWRLNVVNMMNMETMTYAQGVDVSGPEGNPLPLDGSGRAGRTNHRKKPDTQLA